MQFTVPLQHLVEQLGPNWQDLYRRPVFKFLGKDFGLVEIEYPTELGPRGEIMVTCKAYEYYIPDDLPETRGP